MLEGIIFTSSGGSCVGLVALPSYTLILHRWHPSTLYPLPGATLSLLHPLWHPSSSYLLPSGHPIPRTSPLDLLPLVPHPWWYCPSYLLSSNRVPILFSSFWHSSPSYFLPGNPFSLPLSLTLLVSPFLHRFRCSFSLLLPSLIHTVISPWHFSTWCLFPCTLFLPSTVAIFYPQPYKPTTHPPPSLPVIPSLCFLIKDNGGKGES